MVPTAWSCVCCGVAFASGEAQRDHHRSEWHRYNLRRRVAALPPLPLAAFEAKANEAAKAAESLTVDERPQCRVCNKTFATRNAYDNHLQSRKHRATEATVDSKRSVERESLSERAPPDASPDVGSEEDDDSSFEEIEDIFPNDCLFCDHHSKTVTKNVAHMAVMHSFFIPDAEYCVDVKGLLTYLGEKVGQGHMCLWCNDRGRTFYSVEAAQAHMRDKGHCKVLHEGSVLAEYADFYDYSSSYPDHVEGDEDMEIEIDDRLLKTNDDEYELVLPSGAVIGHRSLLRYYKQNLTSHTGAVVLKQNDKLKRIIRQYRAIGWAPEQNEAIAKKAKDIKFMHKAQMKWNTQLGIKANKLQKHFRAQCNF